MPLYFLVGVSSARSWSVGSSKTKACDALWTLPVRLSTIYIVYAYLLFCPDSLVLYSSSLQSSEYQYLVNSLFQEELSYQMKLRNYTSE